MSDHPIRLRGGWEARTAEGESVAARRLTLPLVWPAGHLSPVSLVRSFHRPPLDPEREELLLRLEAVPGLVVVRFNARAIARPPAGTADWLVGLEQPLPGRNLLVLEVDPAAARASGEGDSLWGVIALVIRPRGA